MLPVRNLLQGNRVGLLTGQAVAEKIKAKPLTPQKLAKDEGEVVTRAGFDVRTPLWFYVLKESQVQAGPTNSAPASRNGKRWRLQDPAGRSHPAGLLPPR
jgi:hypothetical protein